MFGGTADLTCAALLRLLLLLLLLSTVQRNKCMHRDFQNIGVNGARTTSMRPQQNGKGIIYGMSRDQEKVQQASLHSSVAFATQCAQPAAAASLYRTTLRW